MEKNIRSTLMAALLFPLVVAGCSTDSISYDITSRNHSITLLRDKPYFWSQAYQQNVVIANLPECQRRYRMEDVSVKRPYKVAIFNYDLQQHLWVMGTTYYLLDHIHCKFQKTEPIDTPDDTFIGEFTVDEKGRLIFINAVNNTVVKGTQVIDSFDKE